MLRPRRLLHGEITYSAAKEKETNILHALGYWQRRLDLFNHLYRNRGSIEDVARHHLGLGSAWTCHIAEPNDWLHWSFNLCVSIRLTNKRGAPSKRLMIRFPLPYRVGEDYRPGNADEKLRCEAGTYAWMRENCLFQFRAYKGLGFPTSKLYFTVLENLPFTTRLRHTVRRWLLGWLELRCPSQYVPHRMGNQILNKLGTGYLLLDYIEEKQERMLLETWNENSQDEKRRANLFRSLSQILLTFARVPKPRIGSFVIDVYGYINLTNRPLTLEIQELENQEIPVNIPRQTTYSTVNSYVHDILETHDSRLCHQPNTVNDTEDGLFQMSALTVMKAVSSHFFSPDFRRGPFFLSLTDFHQSNIFVDENWNIKYIAIDGIDQNVYDVVRNEFMHTLKEEEQKERPQSPKLSQILERGCQMGTFWYSLALDSPTGLFTLFYDHIQPRFAKGHIDDPEFFDPNSLKLRWLTGLLTRQNSFSQRLKTKRRMMSVSVPNLTIEVPIQS
ncbi:hypothetical protein AJ80_00654 [Polytolypa hystricis UAMH7299]|uniref:Aminoglycoside phosphotransferase domain-containing protein n=1 Tax=Polytolypa hystricis (strain UAMH7299) TaxID=1447883 RepID=A0A2B7Z2Q9_POLH7|nr:hypothetical protein AJ80_00654 [Polytolypa hystricis UAMH7299]